MWTEYVGDPDTVEYMMLPRLCAMAEALWSAPGVRQWDGFVQRLVPCVAQLERLGYHFRRLDVKQ